MLILDKELNDSEILSYIKGRSTYWDTCRQLTSNKMVDAFAEAYREIEIFCEQRNSKKELHGFVKKTIDQKQPQGNLLLLSVIAQKIASVDVLARLDGKKFFPSDDWVQQLAWIQSTKLIEIIRAKDGVRDDPIKRAEDWRKKQQEEELERQTEEQRSAEKAFQEARRKAYQKTQQSPTADIHELMWNKMKRDAEKPASDEQ